MIDKATRTRILTFLKANKLSVISTIDSETNKPESAVVAFAERDNLELIFGTSRESRKYKNLQANKNVSLVIGWTDEFGTIQYEGVATELDSDQGIQHGGIMADKNENARAFLKKEDQRYFLVTPTWIRFTDKSKQPQEVIEITI